MSELITGLRRLASPAAVAAASAVAILGAMFLWNTAVVRADTVVTNCTTSGIQAALSAGGVITFNCGASPVTIPITPTLVVSTTVTLNGGNQVTLDGAGLSRIISMTAGSALTLTNITLQNGNAADGQGGGAVRVPVSATLLSANAVYTNNRSTTNGGALLGLSGNLLAIRGSTFISNSANGGTGGGVNADTVTISGSTFISNTASNGGGVNATKGTITGSTFLSNTVGNGGTGGAVNADTVTINGSTLTSNTAVGTGFGGAVSAANATISGSTLMSNTVGSGGFGGGVFTGGGPLTVTNSTFLSNSAGGGGGVAGDTVTITGSTFLSNTAGSGGGGGVNATVAQLTNSTIAGNSSLPGGGAVLFTNNLAMTNTTVIDNGSKGISGTLATLPLTLTNSIVGGSSASLCSQTGTLVGKNVIQDTSCGTGSALIQANPQLGKPQDNGGPTWTMAPLPGSPAIGASPSCLVLVDQRGAPRTSPCDIGAYETGAAPVLTGLVPSTAVALDPSFTLTITGTGFISGTVGLWNGNPRPTTVLNATTLSVTIPASDIAASGVVTVQARYGLATDSISNGLPFTTTARTWKVWVPAVPKTREQ